MVQFFTSEAFTQCNFQRSKKRSEVVSKTFFPENRMSRSTMSYVGKLEHNHRGRMVHPILYLLVREQMHIYAGGEAEFN